HSSTRVLRYVRQSLPDLPFNGIGRAGLTQRHPTYLPSPVLLDGSVVTEFYPTATAVRTCQVHLAQHANDDRPIHAPSGMGIGPGAVRDLGLCSRFCGCERCECCHCLTSPSWLFE